MRAYEFHAYHGDADGKIADRPDITTHNYDETAQAKAYAGRLAKRINGPVDLAFAGPGKWEELYITTAAPSDFHSAGYRLERLDG